MSSPTADYVRVRKGVLERSEGRCVKCGRPAVEVHHVYGRGDNSPDHLRPLCYPCHRFVAPNGDKYWEWERSGMSGAEAMLERATRLIRREDYPELVGEQYEECLNRAVSVCVDIFSRDTGALTSEALQESKRQGKRAGNLAYGWAVDRDDPKGKLVPYPPEQLVVGRIRKLNAEGLSLRGIAKRLNEDGVVTRSGGEWQYTYVRNVLKREELNVKA